MKRRDSLHFDDINQTNLNYSEYLWTQPGVLSEKNSNSTVCFSPANNPSFSKKSYIVNKTLTSKLHKMPLHEDENFLKIEQLSTQPKDSNHSKRKSNIQILKKEIQYLQQESLHSQQFPRNDRCFQFYNKSEENRSRKKESKSLKANKAVAQSSKGFISETNKCSIPQSEQKLKRKWFKSKEKKSQVENKQNKQVKVLHKYELVAPYRKYFPANRFRKNRSSTMKVDQILGRRVTKLSLQQQIR